MGFPEETWRTLDGRGQASHLHTRFLKFASWVDDQPWKSRTTDWRSLGKQGSGLRRWRAKSVPFAANQTRVVRDEYIMALGYAGGGADWFTYGLDTGASWKGPYWTGTNYARPLPTPRQATGIRHAQERPPADGGG